MLSSQGLQGEFYERKIKNLSEDNSILHGENTQLRKMLREAEEYKIKYQLLVTSSTNQILKIKNHYEKALTIQKDQVISTLFKEKERTWKTQLEQIEQKIRQESDSALRDLTNQNIALRQTVQAHQQRNQEMEMYGFKMKRYQQQNEALKQQLEQVRLSCEKQKEEQLASLRSHLNSTFREKTSNLRSSYEAKIVELEKRLIDLETRKDDQQLRMPKSSAEHHQDLKEMLAEKSQLYQQQLQVLTNSLHKKNEEIKLLLEQKLSLQNTYRQEISQQKQQARQLESILLQKQKANIAEIHNIIQRMNAAKKHQIQQLQREVGSLKETLQRQRSIWNQKVLNHDSEVQELKRRFEEEKKKILQEQNLHKKRISDLSIRLREAEGDRQMGQTQMLINSIRDLDAKEDQLGGYENGVVFLQRQLKKCQIKLEEKSRIVTNLYKEINDIRNELNEEIQQLKEKAKKEKKELTERIVCLQSENKSLFDKMRLKEREDRKRERQTYKEKTQLEENNAALKQLVEQLQRDYKRVVEAKKGAESSYRSERQKNLTNVTDTSALKKQKWLQLQKQKNELHIIFRDKQEQLKLQTQQEIDQKTNIIDKLKQELEITKQQNQILKTDNQRFLEELETNKENNRIADYHKKIASLNLEIALTQNIYNSLVKAKSNLLHEQDLTQSIIGIDIRPEHAEHEEREQSNELLMSFFPQQLRGKKG